MIEVKESEAVMNEVYD